MSLVVVGASWGGLRALQQILAALPPGYPHTLAVAQHRAPESDGLASVLNYRSPLPVRDADDKEPMLPGTVYLAPPDYHLLIEGDRFALSVDEPVCYSRPSVDVLFESAAESLGPGLVAVVLTGSNQDGSRGVQRVKAAGGTVVAQDPNDAEMPVMPRSAIATGVVDRVLPLSAIATYLGGLR